MFEVLVVDNNSIDNTLEIVKKYSKRIKIRIINNKIKDAEVSKKIGFEKSKGKFFMYLDADMRMANSNFIEKMLYPFKKDRRISGNFVRFLVNEKHPPLTRTLSYDEFQRDPIFKFFTIGVNQIVVEKNENYWLCKCSSGKIPPQGLMIYKKSLIKNYAKNQKQLIDNDVPAVLVEKGNFLFAFVPSIGIEHLLLRSLKELWEKRIRNLERTYFPNSEERKYKWINWKKDFFKVGIWLIYTNSFVFPVLSSLIKSIKYRDSCFLSEPMLNLVSTYSIIYGVLKNKRK